MVEIASNVVTILLAISTAGSFVYGIYTGINAS